MPEVNSPFILDLAAHVKDAFLHTDIPVQADSLIPADKTFIQMAHYLHDHLTITFPPTKKGLELYRN